MGKLRNKYAGITYSTPPSLIKEVESELDELIKNLLKRLLWYSKKMENLQDDLVEANKTSVAVSQLVSSLHKLCAIKGIEFEANTSQDHIFDLLQKLDPKTLKKVEEIIKNERTQHT